MVDPIVHLPDPDTILEGPFWPGPVRVLRAYDHDNAVRIEAVGVVDSLYYDRTITAEQFSAQVKEVVGGTHSFDAEPRLFRLAVESASRATSNFCGSWAPCSASPAPARSESTA